MCAGSVMVSTILNQGVGAGSNPSSALHHLLVQPIPLITAKKLIEANHYLHTLPGGTKLSFGIFLYKRLMGALTLGVGPANSHCLVQTATREDCLTLSRLWLDDKLPTNSESRVIGVVIRALRRQTSLKFLLSYADPSLGHLGTIYQATGWLYTGLSSAMSLYDFGDGILHHSRSVGQVFGSHSVRRFATAGVSVQLVPQIAKHRYIYFLDMEWRRRLTVPVLPYPKKEVQDGSNQYSPR